MWNLESTSDSFAFAARIKPESVVGNAVVAAMTHRIIRSFRDRGVTLSQSSRLYQYARLFESNLAGAQDTVHVDFDTALLEVLQFEAIRRSVQSAVLSASVISGIAMASGGRFDASSDKTHCKARSIQFELFIWSCLCIAGFDAVLSEPDILVQFDGGRQLAIAAKRPRSKKKIIKNLRDGCEQVAKSKQDGLVVLDLSFVESLAKPVFLSKCDQYQVLAKIVLDGYLEEHAQEVCRAIKEASVIGVLFHYSAVVRTLDEPARAVSKRWVFLQTREAPVDRDVSQIIERFQLLGRGEEARTRERAIAEVGCDRG